MKQNNCTVKGCINFGRYCRIHPTGYLAPVKPIQPRSKKLEEVMKKDYRPQVKEIVEANTPCAVKSKMCTGLAQGFHHLAGREGKELTGKRKIPCCNMCNQFIEKNDAWARANGWKLSKHKDYKRVK